jgi:hypothetical protein
MKSIACLAKFGAGSRIDTRFQKGYAAASVCSTISLWSIFRQIVKRIYLLQCCFKYLSKH